MEVNEPFVFQADSNVVKHHYHSQDNYTIAYHAAAPKEYCVVYFSSNDLYYPNTENSFKESIVQKNRYEWYRNRINYGHKHIFIRDIMKQWYLQGINSRINSPDKLADFIRKEAEGYKLILLGSSAGGFISVILGQMLQAERIYSFNGQFEILSLLKKKNSRLTDPILYRNKNNSSLLQFYNAASFITHPESVFYFHSNRSNWDLEQLEHIGNVKINIFSFKTSNHGIPFLKSNLPVVLNFGHEELLDLKGRTFHPLLFSLKLVGFWDTAKGLSSIVRFAMNKIYISTIQHWKKLK